MKPNAEAFWEQFHGIVYKGTEPNVHPEWKTRYWGVIKIPADRTIKILLSKSNENGEMANSNMYVSIKIQVIHTLSNGLIDSQLFTFDNYMSGRTDDRKDYPLGNNICFYIEDRDDFDWYIAKPNDISISYLIKAINKYINMF